MSSAASSSPRPPRRRHWSASRCSTPACGNGPASQWRGSGALSASRPVIIIGGGRVGRGAAKNLAAAGLDYRIIEQQADRMRDPERYVIGDAADLSVLERAGIRDSGRR